MNSWVPSTSCTHGELGDQGDGFDILNVYVTGEDKGELGEGWRWV